MIRSGRGLYRMPTYRFHMGETRGGGCHFGVPIIRMITFWGLHYGPPMEAPSNYSNTTGHEPYTRVDTWNCSVAEEGPHHMSLAIPSWNPKVGKAMAQNVTLKPNPLHALQLQFCLSPNSHGCQIRRQRRRSRGRIIQLKETHYEPKPEADA